VFNIGDISITPVILGCHAGNFHWNLGLSVVAPTGVYRKGDLAFTSLNYWTVLPQCALTSTGRWASSSRQRGRSGSSATICNR